MTLTMPVADASEFERVLRQFRRKAGHDLTLLRGRRHFMPKATRRRLKQGKARKRQQRHQAWLAHPENWA
jgi:ribosomal protein S21